VDVPGEMLMEPRVTMNDFLKSVKNRYVSLTSFFFFSLSFADDEDGADDGGDVVVVFCSKPTVNTAELQKQIKFTEEFGQEG